MTCDSKLPRSQSIIMLNNANDNFFQIKLDFFDQNELDSKRKIIFPIEPQTIHRYHKQMIPNRHNQLRLTQNLINKTFSPIS